MTALLLMYKLPDNNKISDSHHYEASNRISLENENILQYGLW
jgi:hypothetical protein